MYIRWEVQGAGHKGRHQSQSGVRVVPKDYFTYKSYFVKGVGGG